MVPSYSVLFILLHPAVFLSFFFLNDPAPPEIYTLPLHDALPIWIGFFAGLRPATRRSNSRNKSNSNGNSVHSVVGRGGAGVRGRRKYVPVGLAAASMRLTPDRKSTRLNSSHSQISYAVFCLKKKK